MNPNQKRNNIFANTPENTPSKSLMDLSHPHITSFRIGELVPIATIECLPGDNFTNLSNEVMLRFPAMYFPIMHRVDIEIAWFFVNNRQLWPGPGGWEDFISLKTELEHPVFNVPPFYNDFLSEYKIYDYMGVPQTAYDAAYVATIEVNALPIAAYYKIWDEYYRVDQVQDPLFIPLVAGENDTAYSAASLYHDLLYCNWQPDYFTSAKPTPQIGEDVLIPLFDVDYIPDGLEAAQGPFRWIRATDNQVATPGEISQNEWSAGTGYGSMMSTGTSSGSEVYLDIMETAGTIAQLRQAVMLQEFLEQLMRTGQRYRDMIKGFFGVDPSPLQVDDPVYIGGSKGRVIISEVMQTAQTIDSTDQIVGRTGEYTGQAIALESTPTYQYSCSEHGWLLCLACIKPATGYYQGLHRQWSRRDPYDYAWEHFAGIGDQAIIQKELFLKLEDNPTTLATNDDIFGYIPRYSEYRYGQTVVSGNMRETWLTHHLNRYWDRQTYDFITGNISLNSYFLQCIPRVEDVFKIAAGEHTVYANIWNEVQVLRGLPKYGIPRL